VLAAEDDPLVPVQTVTRWALPMSGVVQREITRTGGHLGFLARTGADGGFWAAERVMEFLDQAWAAVGSTRSRDAAQAPASSTPLDDADPAA
jgi:predicted alpha/beta-fold hydrolase